MNFVVSIGLLLIILPIIHVLLPRFERQTKIARLSVLMNKTDTELKRSLHNPIILKVADQLEKRNVLDTILGVELRLKYEKTGVNMSYEIYISRLLLISILASSSFGVIYLLYNNILFLFSIPVIFVVMLWASLDRLNNLFKKREKLIIQDLPLLFNKLTIALEVGRPIEKILQELSERTNPLMSRMLKTLITNADAYTLPHALNIFAKDINLPIVSNLVSVMNVIREKGFYEAEKDLNDLEADMRTIQRKNTLENNRSKPMILNIFIAVGCVLGVSFMFFMMAKIMNIASGI